MAKRPLTPEQKAVRAARSTARRDTPEGRAAYNERERARHAAETPEQRERRIARVKKYKLNFSPEKRARELAYKREWERKRVAAKNEQALKLGFSSHYLFILSQMTRKEQAEHRHRNAERSKMSYAKRRSMLNAEDRAAHASRASGGALSVLRVGLAANDLFVAADRAVPRTMPTWLRDDIVSDLCMAVLEGEFTIEDIAAHAKAIISKNWSALEWQKSVSLDEPMFDDSRRTLADTIASDREHF